MFGAGKFLLGTCLGRMLVLAGLLTAWLWLDKESALRQLAVNLIADVEMATLKATIEELEHRNGVLKRANEMLVREFEASELEAAERAREIEEWEENNAVNPTCTLDDKLLKQLRAP